MIIAHPGAKSKHPINSQLIMENNRMQYVHNILISMPGSQLTVASTCTYHCGSKDNHQYVVGGKHYGVSEFYVEKDSELCFSMVWFIVESHADPHLVQLLRGAAPQRRHRGGQRRVLQQLRVSGAGD